MMGDRFLDHINRLHTLLIGLLVGVDLGHNHPVEAHPLYLPIVAMFVCIPPAVDWYLARGGDQADE